MSQNRDTRLFTRMYVPLPILEHPSSEPRDRDTSRQFRGENKNVFRAAARATRGGVVSDPSSAHGWGVICH